MLSCRTHAHICVQNVTGTMGWLFIDRMHTMQDTMRSPWVISRRDGYRSLVEPTEEGVGHCNRQHADLKEG